MSGFVLAVVAFGMALSLVAWASQRRLLQRVAPPLTGPFARVSVLKPLRGCDPGLRENLKSFFRLQDPSFELIFGVQDPADPSLDIVRELIAEHPTVPSRLVFSDRRVGLNPKVNNLAGMATHATGEWLVISDSNVRVPADYLTDLRGHAAVPGTGLVTSPIAGVADGGWGGHLESLQLNTFVMGGLAAWTGPLGRTAVVGKSMMLRPSDLRRIGGWHFLGQHLAEDQICGEEIRKLGLRVITSGRPVTNILGRLDASDFARRHLRWARIRRHVHPAGYAAEIVLNPVAVSAGLAIAAPSTVTAGAFLASLALATLLGVSSGRWLGVRRSLPTAAFLELSRSLVVAALWPVPFFSSEVAWRGHALRIGPRTRLLPLPATVKDLHASAAPSEVT